MKADARLPGDRLRLLAGAGRDRGRRRARRRGRVPGRAARLRRGRTSAHAAARHDGRREHDERVHAGRAPPPATSPTPGTGSRSPARLRGPVLGASAERRGRGGHAAAVRRRDGLVPHSVCWRPTTRTGARSQIAVQATRCACRSCGRSPKVAHGELEAPNKRAAAGFLLSSPAQRGAGRGT